jgi:hypothetical protein
MIGVGCGRVGAGHTNGAPLGFTDLLRRVAEKRGPLPRYMAVLGAVGTSEKRHLLREIKKSQPLRMTRRGQRFVEFEPSPFDTRWVAQVSRLKPGAP